MFSSLLLSAALLAPRVATPTYSPGGGSYGSAQNVTVSTRSSGATIYCTTDGSTPRRSSTLRFIGTANQTYYSATAVGTVSWSQTDTGAARSPPIDIGAMKRQ